MKKFIYLTFLGLLFSSLTLFSQTIQWQKSLGGSLEDKGESIQQTSDGGYIAAGYTNSNDSDVSGNNGNYDFWVVKLTDAGNITWQKCLGGSSTELAYSIQQTTDGGYIVAGSAASNNGDVSGNHGNYDFWVVKLSDVGDITWQKCLGGSLLDMAFSIQQTSDGGYIVAGETNSNDGDVTGFHGGDWRDYWVVKLSDVGDITWQKCLGGSGWDFAESIKQTSDGGYIVAGFTYSNDGDVSGHHGGWRDYWVVKLTDEGNISWQKCLGGSGWDTPGSIIQTTDGGYIVAGWTSSEDGDISNGDGTGEYWIVKLDNSGNIIWDKCLGGSSGEEAWSIQQTASGGYIVAGHSGSNDGDVSGNHGNSDYWIVNLDNIGNIIWQKCLGGFRMDEANCIQQTSNGEYIVAGFTRSGDGDVTGFHGTPGCDECYDFWVVKLSNDYITWDGSSDTDWNTSANWSGDFVPTISDNVIIPDVTNDPIVSSTGTASCNAMTINSSASLTVNSGGSLITNGSITNNGTINVERSITDDIWHLISIPNNVTTANTFLGDYLQTWNEATASWSEIIAPATNLAPIVGYSLWGTAKTATTYTFTGTPNTGNQSIAVSYTEVSGYDNDGTNLLGNPYPSSIDWSGLDDTWGAVYYWNGTQYATWNNGSATNGGVQYIPPMQGFFIVVSSSGTFNLTNDNRTHNGATGYFKSTEEITANSILLEAKSGNLNDELLIRFKEESSPDFELQHDAYKFLSTTEGLSQLYSYAGEKILSIDVRPETEIIQLGFKNNENGIYSIGIKEIANISEAIIEDTKTDTYHNLQTGSYDFAWDVTDNEKRFILHLNALGINADITNSNEILIYTSEKTIYIKNKGNEKNALLKIMDITGKTVMEQNIKLNDVTSIPTNLKTGVYVVSLISNNSIKTQKIIIK